MHGVSLSVIHCNKVAPDSEGHSGRTDSERDLEKLHSEVYRKLGDVLQMSCNVHPGPEDVLQNLYNMCSDSEGVLQKLCNV